MDIIEPLEENVILNFSAKDKWEAISKIAVVLARNNAIDALDLLVEEIYTRERQISTGLEFGVAMPHVKTNLVQDISYAVAIAQKGLEFETLDSTLVRIIVLVLCPKERADEHMQLMASLSRLLSVEEQRARLLAAHSAQEVVAVFMSN